MLLPKSKLRMHDTVMLSGWLFADLLLALTIIFLSANTGGVKPKPTPTPIPTSTAPSLDFTYQTITLDNIDYAGLLSDSQQVKDDLKQRIRGYSFLPGHSVGLAIAYGGAPTTSDIGQARTIAGKAYGILQELGQSGFAFQRTSYYPDPNQGLYNLGDDPSLVVIDVYLFKQ